MGGTYHTSGSGGEVGVPPAKGGTNVGGTSQKSGLHLRSWLRLLFLARYPVLTGLTLPGLALLALVGAPALLGNLLVLDDPLQLFNVTWLALMVATMVVVAFRVIQLNALARFADYRDAKPPAPAAAGNWRRRLLLLVLGLSVPGVCVGAIARDPSQAWEGGSLAWTGLPVWGQAALALLGGIVFALMMLAILSAIEQLLLHPAVIADGLLPFASSPLMRRLRAVRINWLYGVGSWLARGLTCLGPGYTQEVTDTAVTPSRTFKLLAPGHAQVFLWFMFALLGYATCYGIIYGAGWIPQENAPFGALFYLLLLVLLVGSLLSGLSFLLDYYRVPVLLMVILVSMLLYQVAGVDHFYELDPAGPGHDRCLPAADLELRRVFAKRKFPPVARDGGDVQGGKRTLVVVTAAGGGIQASAWTTQVLAGLDERYGSDFTRSVGLISGVSGGSVGAMYYLANGQWSGNGPTFDAAARDRMRHMSRASSLEATAWGIAHPDLMRTFAPFLLDPRIDRGWAIEKAWGQQLDRTGDARGGDLRLRDWVQPIQDGEMPVVVFNATLVETGQRLLISPVRGSGAPANAAAAREFFDLYPAGANPRVTTAVRLSATFPYVSPISRPYRADRTGSTPLDFHVADGGYADNEGAVTVIDWVHDLIAFYRLPENRAGKPFDRVLLIRIQPFPTADDPTAEIGRGWLYAAAGPITTIENVRSASQAERISLGLELLTEATAVHTADSNKGSADCRERVRARGVLTQARIAEREMVSRKASGTSLDKSRAQVEENQRAGQQHAMAAVMTNRKAVEEREITWTTFSFRPRKRNYSPPLSWKLTRGQVQEIEDAWTDLCQGKSPEIPNNGLQEPPLKTIDRFFNPVGK